MRRETRPLLTSFALFAIELVNVVLPLVFVPICFNVESQVTLGAPVLAKSIGRFVLLGMFP